MTIETVMDIATAAESVKPQLYVMEPSGIQHRCVVESTEIPLDNAEGDNSQPGDLPQSESQIMRSEWTVLKMLFYFYIQWKTRIQRFFSRVWKILKYSTHCCCCSVSMETD
ncbi:hypothetical protein AAFF_G00365560 [Aldrovandia affinis]|uniref:Uncharacterized protein n=1 Tax=Aldrovandia affinis TaxID=143900 RepID=A0AAD7SH91_9TELE|nr:hypothetical protein AAFF_G00365560 [Aldrovandia affinis]